MTDTTYTSTHSGPSGTPTTGVSGFFRKLYNSTIEARTRQMESRTLSFLIVQSDKTLAGLGYSPAEIRDIRARKRLPKPTGRYFI